MPAIQLTPAERKEKRGEAHHLDPVVLIGAEGLTAAVLKEADAALKAHGLIKVRMFSDSRDDREATLGQLAEQLGAAAVAVEHLVQRQLAGFHALHQTLQFGQRLLVGRRLGFGRGMGARHSGS